MSGRPKGALNRRSTAGRDFALRILESPEYLESIMRRMLSDTLPPLIESQLQHYAWGKPIEKTMAVDIDPADDLTTLTDDALAQRAAAAAAAAMEVARVSREQQKAEALALLERSPGAIAEAAAAKDAN